MGINKNKTKIARKKTQKNGKYAVKINNSMTSLSKINNSMTPVSKINDAIEQYSKIALLILSKTYCVVSVDETATLCRECPFKTTLDTCFVVQLRGLHLFKESKSISTEQYTQKVNDIKAQVINWLIFIYGESTAKGMITEALL